MKSSAAPGGQPPAALAAAHVSLDAILRTALTSLNQSALGIVLVTDAAGTLRGVMTDGDVRRALLAGVGLDKEIRPFLRRDFIAVDASTPRDTVLDLMQARRIEQVPVVDPYGRVVGVHTLHAILRREGLPNWAVVMAGGRGERLRPLTDSIPKPMVKVAGRPIIERIVLNLAGAGITRIFVSVHYRGDQIRTFLGDGSAYGCRIDYLVEAAPLGTGGALSLLPETPVDPVIVLNGDLLTQCDAASLLRFHAEGRNTATVAYHDYVHTVPFGVLDLDGTSVQGMREKPCLSWAVNAGIYVLDPEVVGRVPRGVHFPAPALLEECLERGERVGAYRIEGDWMDIGRPAELRRARGEADDT